MPYLVKNYKTYFADKRIWRTSDDRVGFTGTVKSEGVQANEEGKKIVPIGSFISKDGEVCKLTESEFDKPPIGITDYSVDVTYGDEPVDLVVAGYPYGEALNWEGKTGTQDTDDTKYTKEAKTALEAVLPHIVMQDPEEAV